MILIISIIIIFILLIIYIIYDNIRIKYDTYIEDSNFNLNIVQISDLHSRKININKLVNNIKKINPDIIFYTGDMVNNFKDDINISLKLMKELSNYKSCFILGNHEYRLKDKFNIYLDSIEKLGIKILKNEIVSYNDIKIAGTLPLDKYDINENVDILLAHEPELIAKYKANYIFSGHAHGGQFRFFNKGLYSPGQGIFPKYTKGRYVINNKVMYVSAGIGGKDFPIRLFNPPHIIIVRFNRHN